VESHPAVSPSSNPSQRILNALRDAGDTLVQLLRDPVGQVPAVFSRLGAGRAGDAGVILCVITALLMALGLTQGAGPILGSLAFGLSPFERSALSLFFIMLFRFVVMAAVMILLITLLKRLAGGKGPFGQEMFTVGVALAPLGIAVLIAGFIAGAQLATLLVMFAAILTVMLLLSGFTGVCGCSTRLSSIGVPVVLIAGSWLPSLLF
jgi:hypothetical protein